MQPQLAMQETDLAQLAGSLMQARQALPANARDAPVAGDALAAGLASLQSESWAVAGNNAHVAALADRPGPAVTAAVGPVPVQALQLVTVTAEMQRFLTQHAGMEGLPVVLMLEQIRSLAQCRQELPDYLALIAPFGEAAQAHARHLHALLDTAG